MQPETQQQDTVLATSAKTAQLANQLLLLGQAIATFVTDNKIIIAASYIKLIAAFLFINAVATESKEQQIAPGVTTPLNQQKMLGSIISTIGAIILIIVLQKETALKEAGILPPITPTIPPFTGAAFV
jgi:hypothetical protein